METLRKNIEEWKNLFNNTEDENYKKENFEKMQIDIRELYNLEMNDVNNHSQEFKDSRNQIMRFLNHTPLKGKKLRLILSPSGLNEIQLITKTSKELALFNFNDSAFQQGCKKMLEVFDNYASFREKIITVLIEQDGQMFFSGIKNYTTSVAELNSYENEVETDAVLNVKLYDIISVLDYNSNAYKIFQVVENNGRLQDGIYKIARESEYADNLLGKEIGSIIEFSMTKTHKNIKIEILEISRP